MTRIVFLTLELVDPIFSGNGVYSRSIAAALLRQGFELLIVCGLDGTCILQKSGDATEKNHNGLLEGEQSFTTAVPRPDGLEAAADILAIPLGVWRRLDEHSDWQGFCTGVSSGSCVQKIRRFQPDLFVTVDWTGAAALRALREAFSSPMPSNSDSSTHCLEDQDRSVCQVSNANSSPWSIARVPTVWFNFRIFHAANTEFSETAKQFYRVEELRAVEDSNLSLACSSADRDMLVGSITMDNPKPDIGDGETSSSAGTSATQQQSVIRENHVSSTSVPTEENCRGNPAATCSFLNPPLRDAFTALLEESASLSPSTNTTNKRFVLCCCRLSVEKRVDFFVDLVCHQQVQSLMRQMNVQPFLVGARKEGDAYADALLEKLDREWGLVKAKKDAPSDKAIVLDFVSPKELIQILGETVLNIHPPLYDSYGMTIPESAACGVPTLVNDSGIGAADCLGEAGLFRADLSNVESAAARLEQILCCGERIREVSAVAKSRAWAWRSGQFGEALAERVREVVDSSAKQAHVQKPSQL